MNTSRVWENGRLLRGRFSDADKPTPLCLELEAKKRQLELAGTRPSKDLVPKVAQGVLGKVRDKAAERFWILKQYRCRACLRLFKYRVDSRHIVKVKRCPGCLVRTHGFNSHWCKDSLMFQSYVKE